MAQLCSNWLKVFRLTQPWVTYCFSLGVKHTNTILRGVDKRFMQGLGISTGICYTSTRFRILGIRARSLRLRMQYLFFKIRIRQPVFISCNNFRIAIGSSGQLESQPSYRTIIIQIFFSNSHQINHSFLRLSGPCKREKKGGGEAFHTISLFAHISPTWWNS